MKVTAMNQTPALKAILDLRSCNPVNILSPSIQTILYKLSLIHI